MQPSALGTGPRRELPRRGSNRWLPRESGVRWVVVLLLVLLTAAACGSDGDEADGSSTPDGSTTSTSATSTTGSTATAAPPAKRRPVADLEQALTDEISRKYPPGPGRTTCEASGTLTDWQPIACGFEADEPQEYGPIYVSILTGGQYTVSLGFCCAGGANPGDYPKGLMCRDLVEPPSLFPPDHYLPEYNSLGYGLAVYYWFTEGRPDRMDADGNGRPCETVYPADEVQAYWESIRTL
jgi:hypothetical protein